jgi:hypothetical protein
VGGKLGATTCISFAGGHSIEFSLFAQIKEQKRLQTHKKL